MNGRPGYDPDSVTLLWCVTDGEERRAAHALLLRSAAGLLGVRPSEIRLEHEPGGRPYLGGAGKELHVSVAHGRGVLAVALTGRAPVGVDVEAVRPLRAEAMARAWLGPAETGWVTGLPEPDRSAGFLWLWTQKESVGKALGRGLRRGGMSREVPLPERWPVREGAPLVPRPLPGTPDVVSGAALVGGERYVVGVALHGDPGGDAVRVRLHRPAPGADG